MKKKYFAILVEVDDNPEHQPWTGEELASLLSDSCQESPLLATFGHDLTEAEYEKLTAQIYHR